MKVKLIYTIPLYTVFFALEGFLWFILVMTVWFPRSCTETVYNVSLFQATGTFQGTGSTHVHGVVWPECEDYTHFVLVDDGAMFFHVTGKWVGDLPPAKHQVRILSPTGKVEDVVIIDLDDEKKEYRSK